MMHKVINGYTVLAHTHKDGLYWILGSRRIGPASYEYVVAGMRNFDLDTQWVTSGIYTTNIQQAVEAYNKVGAL
jgi:hypothetical protein